MKTHLIFIALVLALTACLRQAPPATPVGSIPAITIMTFNVENLFDTRDDPGKDDKAFLPLAAKQTVAHRAACAGIEVPHWREQCFDWDWSEAILERKLGVVADAILQVNDGRGPDIVALQEVENLRVLERLRSEYLADAGYLPGILIEGDDERGIDVAFLSRLETEGGPILHDIPFEGIPEERVADTRGILEATFRLTDGSLLTGYSVHFPAPFHPTEMRVAAYEFLNRLEARLPDDRAAFAAGDFNTTSTEDREKSMLDRFARPQWTVVHELCEGCPGTNYYAREDNWSFLDMILWAPADRSAHATWKIREDSVRLVNDNEAQLREDGTPARFELPEGTGVSDHWPLAVTLETK